MQSIMGTYENGIIKLEEKPEDESFSKVVVTFLKEKKEKEGNEDAPKILKWEDFHFEEARKITSKCKTSFSDTLIEERRREL